MDCIYDISVVLRHGTHTSHREQAVIGSVFEAGGILRASSGPGLKRTKLEGIRRYGTE